jgi:two-component system heavy metal sensor histidine kinase CusS
MRSLGARLVLWYTVVSTVMLAALVAVGFYLLSHNMVHSLDLLNLAEFENVKSRLGPALAVLTAEDLDKRMRSFGERGALVFYIEIRETDGRVVFSSRNLYGQQLSAGGTRSDAFDIELPGIGKVRAGRFPLEGRAVVVASPKALIEQVMDGYAQVGLVLVALSLVASVVVGLVFSEIALRPVRIIQETANRIRSDNLSQRIPVSDVHDEISDLARLLNEMFDRLESSFNQIRRFSAEASHELKTPLSLLRLEAEKLLVNEGLTPDQQEAVQVQMDEIGRLEQIIEDLLFLSRAEAQAVTLAVRHSDSSEFLETFVPDARVLAEHRGVRFAARIERGEPADFDPKWIRQVLLNLLTNALNVSPRGSLVTLESEFTVDGWHVAIEDEGPGVPSDQRERIFERFVRLPSTGAEVVEGTGLGLAIVLVIIQLHHGTIRAEAGPRKGGLRVVFELPLARPKPVRLLPSKPAEPQSFAGHSSMNR